MPKFSDEAVAAALNARHAFQSYPFPGLDGVSVGVRLLHGSEVAKIRIDAVAHCKDHRVDLVMDPDFLDLVIMRLTILAAFYDIEDKQAPFFTREQAFKLDSALARTLYDLYLAHQSALDPLTHCATEEEVNAVIAGLGKSEIPLARLSLFDAPTRLNLLLSMAYLLRSK